MQAKLLRLIEMREVREDLFHRIAQPHVRLPPLRERREEIPWMLIRAISRVSSELQVHASFVEACLHRSWSGNVRELLQHGRAAGHAAMAAGERSVTHAHLDPTAGFGVDDRRTDPDQEPARSVSREAVERALAEASGNVAAAARALNLHRTQLYRVIKRLGIVPPREE